MFLNETLMQLNNEKILSRNFHSCNITQLNLFSLTNWPLVLFFSLTWKKWNYFRNISSNFAWNHYLKMHWDKHTCSHTHFTSKSDENYWWTISWWIGNMNWHLIAKMAETLEIWRLTCNFTSGKMESHGTQDVCWIKQFVKWKN